MTDIDQIIVGDSCSVQDGAVLLGLASWHIYPDLYVLTATIQTVLQRDLMAALGEMATVGLLSTNSPDHEGGVLKSLPLAHLRFYKAPEPVSRTLAETSTQLTIPNFLQIVSISVFAA